MNNAELDGLIERLRRRNFYVIVSAHEKGFVARGMFVGDHKRDLSATGTTALGAAEALERAIDASPAVAPATGPPRRITED